MAMRAGRSLSSGDLRGAEDAEKETLLDHDSEPDEDMLFNRTSSADGQLHIDGKISSVRIQIKEVTDVMRDNVHKVMERGERLEDLQVASDRLSSAGNEFREAARKAQRRAWMQNVRSRIIIIAITITAILCIVVRHRRMCVYTFQFWMSWRFTWFSGSQSRSQSSGSVPIIVKYS